MFLLVEETLWLSTRICGASLELQGTQQLLILRTKVITLCIYIYMHISIHIHLYIYIHIGRYFWARECGASSGDEK